jgi:hypothetical protein
MLDGLDASVTPIYCGHYTTSKLLLSRMSWKVSEEKYIKLSNFSVKLAFRCMLYEHLEPISAIERWELKAGFTISHVWAKMIT